MCKKLHSTILGLLLIPPWLHAQEPLGTASNAATVLRRAIEQMPDLTDEQNQWLRDGTEPTPENHAELLKSMEPSLQLMRRAAEMPECDWEIPYEEEGPNVVLTHVQPMLTLSRMAQRHAEAQLPHNPRGFLDDSLTALSSARYLGTGRFLISVLLEGAVETRTMDSLARHLPELPDEALASLAAAHPISAGVDLRKAIAMEKAAGPDWFIKKMRRAMDKQQGGYDGTYSQASSVSPLADQFRMSGIIETDDRPIRIGLITRAGDSFWLQLGQNKHGLALLSADFEREEAVLAKDGETALLHLDSGMFTPLDLQLTKEIIAEVFVGAIPEEMLIAQTGLSVLEMLQETSAHYDRLIESLSLPPDEFRQWATVFEEEILNANPLSREFMPALVPARERVDGVMVRREMLKAAITILQAGPEAIKDSVDPFGTGPFTYRETDGGFELVSALTVKDIKGKRRPVTLSVGNAPQL